MRMETGPGVYTQELFAKEDSILRTIHQSVIDEGCENMQVSPVEGKMLQVLMKMNKVQSVVEIGTLHGYSCLWMARGLPQNGKIFSFDLEKSRHEIAQKFIQEAGLSKKVEMIAGDAVENLEKISCQGPFDMVFIDANKTAYPKYLDWAEQNTKKGSLIVGDNTFLFGAVLGTPRHGGISKNQIAAMNEFNLRLADESKYDSVILPTLEGMTVAVRKN